MDNWEKASGERQRGARGSVILISGRDDPEGRNRAQEGPGLTVPMFITKSAALRKRMEEINPFREKE